MRQGWINQCLGILLGLWFCLCSPGFAESVAVAKVVAVSGQVQAKGASSRVLARRSEVYANDEIHTAKDSKVQLVFSDGGYMTVQPDSVFKVASYQVGQAGSFKAELVSGGLKTLTGAIGKNNPEQYEIKTPVATIGVRGTFYGVDYQTQRGLSVQVDQGAVRVVDQQQRLMDVAADSATRYATVSQSGLKALSKPNTALARQAVDHTPTHASTAPTVPNTTPDVQQAAQRAINGAADGAATRATEQVHDTGSQESASSDSGDDSDEDEDDEGEEEGDEDTGEVEDSGDDQDAESATESAARTLR